MTNENTAEEVRGTPLGRQTLDVAETADVLGLSRASIYRAIHRGELEAIRLGRRLLVPRRALSRLLTAARESEEHERRATRSGRLAGLTRSGETACGGSGSMEGRRRVQKDNRRDGRL